MVLRRTAPSSYPLRRWKLSSTVEHFSLFFSVPIPNANFGHRSLGVKLIAPFRTKEMVGSCVSCHVICRCKRQQPSPNIIFHVHGGGFIAQTSQSHESYLRIWANKLGTPILSVDYTTAPEGAYPRSLITP